MYNLYVQKRPFFIRNLSHNDQSWVKRFLVEHWEDSRIVTPYTIHQADQLPGFMAIYTGDDKLRQGEIVGLITYHIQGNRCEIVSLDSLIEALGIGSALIDSVQRAAKAKDCHCLWLVTSNDNLLALRFYQKRGFQLSHLHRNAMERVRLIKPSVPLIGNDGIPLRDLFELEMVLPE